MVGVGEGDGKWGWGRVMEEGREGSNGGRESDGAHSPRIVVTHVC